MKPQRRASLVESKGGRGHTTAALLSAAIGALTAFASGTLGAPGTAGVLAALLVGWGRSRRWAVSCSLEKPRAFDIAGGFYIPIFLADLAIGWHASPVFALVRLVAFLLIAESLAGDPTRSHRPVLLGLLLIVSAATETTEVFFLLPLVAFALTAVAAQMTSTLSEQEPRGASPVERGLAAPVGGLVAGSMVLGAVFFFAIPRVGAGWGRPSSAGPQEANLETGLADSVSLGTVGRVKQRRRVAFTARLIGDRSDPDLIYWRGRTFGRWTGDGWAQEETEKGMTSIDLPAGRAVPLPGETLGQVGREIEASIEMKLGRSPVLLSPGRAIWVRTPGSIRLLAGSDGTLRSPAGRTVRRYAIGARRPRPAKTGRELRRGGGRADEHHSGASTTSERDAALAELPEEIPCMPSLAVDGTCPLLEVGEQSPRVRSWAEAIAPGLSDARAIARAFVGDLARRPYSLDTTEIDANQPVASLLAGAPGHCEYFASAMAIGLRIRNIPSRVVGGYLGADRSAFSDTLVVRESRAHMWVEAFVPEIGWMRFDPTPPEGRFTPSEWRYAFRRAWEQVVLSWDGLVIGLDLGDQADLFLSARDWIREAGSAVGRLPKSAILAVAALLLATAWRAARRRRPGSKRPAAELPALYRRFLSVAARSELHRRPSETAREFAMRAAERLGDESAVWLINRLYERERFGAHPVSPAELARARDALARLAARSRQARTAR